MAAKKKATARKTAPAKGEPIISAEEVVPDKGSFFTRFSGFIARHTGRPIAFFGAFALVLGWAVAGPFVGYSETWQLVINTSTTIITFLMVFVIQASQNRDTAALHLKLDELIRATVPAHNALLDIDNLDEQTLEEMRHRYEALAREAARESPILDALAPGAPQQKKKAAAKA
jgi:low affinity Fe/Cu permease